MATGKSAPDFGQNIKIAKKMIAPGPGRTSLKAIAQELLGRAVKAEDGLEPEIIAQAESALGSPIPQPLKDFYLFVGNLPLFMDAFQQFALPEQIVKEAGLLIFLDENQGVCQWGVDAENRMFQCQDDDRYDIKLELEPFLALMLYYQVAQGGEYGYSVGLTD